MSSMVLFRCPRTDRAVALGFTADLVGLASLIHRRTEFRCRGCGMRHVLSDGNAWLSLTHPLVLLGRKRKRGSWYTGGGR